MTRADWALDDRKGLLSLERILEADEKGAIVTRWQGLTVIQNRQRGQRRGWTVYIGSRSSEAFCRIYDKAAEQGRDGVHWVRFEFETKGAFADALAREVLAHGAGAVVQQINRRIRFVQPSPTDSNIRRAKVANWWRVCRVHPAGGEPACVAKGTGGLFGNGAWGGAAAGPALATSKAAR